MLITFSVRVFSGFCNLFRFFGLQSYLLINKDYYFFYCFILKRIIEGGFGDEI